MASDRARFVIDKAKDGQYYWRFRARNGEIICHSETYTTKQSCQNSIQVMQREVPQAEVLDVTKTDNTSDTLGALAFNIDTLLHRR